MEKLRRAPLRVSGLPDAHKDGPSAMGRTEMKERSMSKVTHEFDLYGKHYVLETGELAKQATGAVLVKQGDTTVLMTAVVSRSARTTTSSR